MVRSPAPVALNVAVITPVVGSVVPLGGVSVLPAPPAVRTTLAPPITLPPASRAVTVIVLVPDPAGIEAGAASTVEVEADTAPAVTVTGAVWVIATVLIVAEIVFPPVVVELHVAVRTPVVGSVVPVAGVRVFPVPPVAVRLTLAPPIGLPPASRAVTVIVLVPDPAGIEAGAASTVEVEADTAPAVTVTGAVWVIATVLIVAEIVFPPVVVELHVAVRTPVVGSVVPVAGVRVFPVPPVAVRLTLAPPIGLPPASRAVTVIVLVPDPAGIEAGAASTVEVEADTAPAVTVTGAVCVIATVLIVAEIVFPPVVVELNVAVRTPVVGSVVPVAGVRVFPVPPVAVRLTLAPPIGLPPAARAVTVIVLVPDPAGIDAGAASTVEVVADTAPAVTVTGAVWVIATVLIVAEIVFPPVVVELNVAVRTPVVGSVVPVAGVRVFPVPPVAVRLTLAPPIGLPSASRAVTVMVLLPDPAGIDAGAAVTVDCDADTAPALSAIAPELTGVIPVPPEKLSV